MRLLHKTASPINIPRDIGRLSVATWNKITAALAKTIESSTAPHDVTVASGLAGVAHHSHTKRLIGLAGTAIQKTASVVMHTAANVPSDEATGADRAAIGQLQRLITDARKSGNKKLVSKLQKDVQTVAQNYAQSIADMFSAKITHAGFADQTAVLRQQLRVTQSGGNAATDPGLYQAQLHALEDKRGLLGSERGTLAGRLQAAVKSHNAALVTTIQGQLDQVDQDLAQSKLDTATLQQQFAQAIHDAFIKQIDDAAQAFQANASLAATNEQIAQAQQHLGGTDLGQLQTLASQQGGFLTAGQKQAAQANLTELGTSTQAQIAQLQGEEGQYQAEAASAVATPGERQAAQQNVANLVLQILQLQGALKDQTDATNQLVNATTANTQTLNSSQTFGGSVGFTYQNQGYVAGGQTANSAADMRLM